jgi:hypothetical protein
MRPGRRLGILIVATLLASFLAFCDEWPLEEEESPYNKNKIEHTDVEYSEDGSEIRLYLDGTGVPKTKSQRAITTELAVAAYDYIEVIFINTTPARTVRTAWELGQQANISDIYRTVAGVDYSGVARACMFVGRKENKVLLGVGVLSGTKPTAANATTINNETRSVTFTVGAIRTGLQTGNAGFDAGVTTNSFTYTGRAVWTPTLGGMQYPAYRITNTTTGYAYAFECSTVGFTTAVRHTTPVNVTVQQRVPRYPDGTGYKEPRNWITSPAVTLGAYTAAGGGTFVSSVPIGINFASLPAKGIFAFNIQIPVYMVSTAAPFSGGTEYVTWYIRTGVGSEFFSLDDGRTRGGCVLMCVGLNALADWDEIEWIRFK